MIDLLGKDGKMWKANLVREIINQMSVGKGWKFFAEANEVKSGESTKLELVWDK